ncbi:MAG: hypothetical protein KAR47_13540 [Planctomycetes bacterium]|nr:hypothetical protein [Planctomycetota bacterium]
MTIRDGIVIGAAGGFFAGIGIWLCRSIADWRTKEQEGKRVYEWLKKHASEECYKFRTTQTIASHNNLTQDRVRYLCSYHKGIKLSTGEKDDLWTIRR